MKPHKILFIEPCFVNFGGYFRAFNICLNLSEKGVDVDLLCAAQNPFQWTIKKTKINKHLTRYELPRYNFHFFFNGRILRGVIGLLFGLFRRYDIIHAAVPVQLEANIPAFFLKLLGKKVVMDWDDYWEGSTIYGEYRIMKKYVAWCEQKAPGFFKYMVVVSDFLENLAKKRGATHVLKLINGVNKKQFTPYSREVSRKKLELDPKGKYLITFGNTYINERAKLLFKVFEYIVHEDPSVKLMFNFDPYALVKEQKLEDYFDTSILKNIINVGYIKQEDQGYYLGAADAVIFLMGDSDMERACFPIRIGSYLNGEAVIVVNDVNSEAANSLKPYGCAIIEKDIKKLAHRTVEFLNDPALHADLREKTRRAKEKLSWDKSIDALLKFYTTVLRIPKIRW